MKSTKGNLLLGLFILGVSIYISINELLNDNTELSTMGFLLFSVSIVFFSLSYLNSQYQANDERIKMIREKAMYFTFFLIMFYFLLFIVLIGSGIIIISSSSILHILGGLILITAFLSQVILSKIY
ncbi:permease [Bacillus shivajii]|uniref:permease n=1 Tax=Bacillus shivajii TaxID=1983719 RepID=UPI001CFBCBFB|nr:permease [Bacillus shivajii]UCZ53472.1 permease [Bacillus shivajii]